MFSFLLFLVVCTVFLLCSVCVLVHVAAVMAK